MQNSTVRTDARLGCDAAAARHGRAPDLDHRPADAGHFMAEEAPDETTEEIRDLVLR
ncbi:hypothetical protein ACFWNI_04290 [Streptomyces sp. NPDC058377]|uniref:hypothetical protein n=1 Tax=Streptomyces sp. NPDC058377 TaxID=3346468 RepID=UPI00365CEF03